MTLVGLCDLILGEVTLGHGVVTLVGLGDLILGDVRLGHGVETLVGLGDLILVRQNVYTTKRITTKRIRNKTYNVTKRIRICFVAL